MEKKNNSIAEAWLDNASAAKKESRFASCLRGRLIKEKMSMVELYRMEIFLASGSRDDIPKKVPPEQEKRIQSEYNLSKIKNRYQGNWGEVWAVLSAKFPDQTARYRGYKECQYALKYGAVPCQWQSPKNGL